MKTLRSFLITLCLVAFLLVFTHCASKPRKNANPWRAGRPERVMIIVMDQFRRDFLNRFELPNLRRLQRQSVDFVESKVGHLTSNTVVSHPVITTGLFPKNLPWVDHLGRDVNGVLGKKGALFSPLDLKAEEMSRFFSYTRPTSLLSRLSGEPDQKFVVAQKAYAAYSYGVPLNSMVLTLGGKESEGALKGWRLPTGVNLPGYFTEPLGGRFAIDARDTYGSERTLYPLDGARFVRGNNPEHLGGDVWVADATLAYLKQTPDWKAVLVSFGALDKILHMLAEHDSPSKETWPAPEIRLAAILKELDDQIGRLLDYLEAQDLIKETVIVATADHGGQDCTSFQGFTDPGRGLEYLQYGEGVNFHLPHAPSSLTPLLKTGFITAMTHDTALSLFTKNLTPEKTQTLVSSARKLPGAFEVYVREKVRERYYFVRLFRASDASSVELEYAKENHASLVDTMAGPQGPEVLVLLKKGYGYGLRGDHGGAQAEVQSIPLLFWAPNLKPVEAISRQSTAPARLVDINAMVSAALKLPAVETDGSASPILPYLAE